MIALICVRDGTLPIGADEAVAEAGGRVAIVGDDPLQAARNLRTASEIHAWEAGVFRPGAWAGALARQLDDEPLVLLPHSADGRDLAPRLSSALGRQLLRATVEVSDRHAVLARHDSRAMEHIEITVPVVCTLLVGLRGIGAHELRKPPEPELDELEVVEACDAEPLELVASQPEAIDLAEAKRVIAGGGGLGSGDAFDSLQEVAHLLRASVGATRVVTDAGLVSADRQIGTTGVAIDPDLYLALGVSGAVQHTAGLGSPEHVVAVNTDPSAPMMEMADLALVVDARSLLHELRALLA